MYRKANVSLNQIIPINYDCVVFESVLVSYVTLTVGSDTQFITQVVRNHKLQANNVFQYH